MFSRFQLRQQLSLHLFRRQPYMKCYVSKQDSTNELQSNAELDTEYVEGFSRSPPFAVVTFQKKKFYVTWVSKRHYKIWVHIILQNSCLNCGILLCLVKV